MEITFFFKKERENHNIQTCEADWTLEGSSHALKAVLDQMALKLRRGVK